VKVSDQGDVVLQSVVVEFAACTVGADEMM
jgi:hypothetical protein